VAGDDVKLIGDLPRRRPGNRSPKRPARGPQSGPDGPVEPAPARGVTAGEAATEPLRLAVGAAEAGLKVVSRLTGELIRRVPRL
jgi:hypothetical protein